MIKVLRWVSANKHIGLLACKRKGDGSMLEMFYTAGMKVMSYKFNAHAYSSVNEDEKIIASKVLTLEN